MTTLTSLNDLMTFGARAGLEPQRGELLLFSERLSSGPVGTVLILFLFIG